jgi:hypothetical protein
MPKLRKSNGLYIVDKPPINATDDLLLECGNELEVNMQKVDNRYITGQQRKFIFALCKDFSDYTGYDKEEARDMLQTANAQAKGIDVKSLSNCDMTYANGLIDYIITYFISNDIPFNANTIRENQYTFDEKQTYIMALKRVCVVCGQIHADIHHVDHIGNGFNRNKISHIGKRALPLCRVHHAEVHSIGEQKFLQKYHLSPFVINKNMEYFIKKGKIKVFEEDLENAEESNEENTG